MLRNKKPVCQPVFSKTGCRGQVCTVCVGTGSMIDMMEKVDPNDRTKDREPEDFELRYFTEMEVAGLMGFPKDFSFPPDLTTRQVQK